MGGLTMQTTAAGALLMASTGVPLLANQPWSAMKTLTMLTLTMTSAGLVKEAAAARVVGDPSWPIERKCFGMKTGGILEYTGLSTNKPYTFLFSSMPTPQTRSEPASGCEPLMFMLLGRDGTRYPTKEEVGDAEKRLPTMINATLTAHEKLQKGTLSMDILNDLRQWKLPFPERVDKEIHAIGTEEWRNIANIYKTIFPSFLNRPYSADYMKFKGTDQNRTIASAEAFEHGLFVETGKLVSIEDKTNLLRFDQYCKRWIDRVDKDPPESLIEQRKFVGSCPYHDMLDRVTSKLGLDDQLTPSDLEAMYEECQMETAHCPCCESYYPKSPGEQTVSDQINGFNHLDSETCKQCTMPSPWCKIFSEDDLKVMEYWNDLKWYWQDGYGYDLNYEQSCILVKELVDQLTKKMDETPTTKPPKTLLYFMHSGGLAKLLARLGMFKDAQHPTAENFDKMGNRKWRTSRFMPFASNLVFAHYRCGDNIQTIEYMNGEEINIPLFREKGSFLGALRPIADACDYDKMCENSAPKGAPPKEKSDGRVRARG